MRLDLATFERLHQDEPALAEEESMAMLKSVLEALQVGCHGNACVRETVSLTTRVCRCCFRAWSRRRLKRTKKSSSQKWTKTRARNWAENALEKAVSTCVEWCCETNVLLCCCCCLFAFVLFFERFLNFFCFLFR